MCRSSYLYTFSDVAKYKFITLTVYRGLPYQNCTKSIADYINFNFPIWGGMFFLFAALILNGLIASFIICCCFKEDSTIKILNINNREYIGKGDRLH